MFYSQRKSTFIRLNFLIYSKPSLLRQVVTNTLWKICKRMTAGVLKHIAKEIKGNARVDSHTSVLKISTNRCRGTRDTRSYLYIKT